jgi:hypothetical protein
VARTTLDIDDTVLRELKRRRSREHRPIGAIVSELLARALAEGSEPRSPASAWRSAPMGAPKVDLDDQEAVWKALDDE